MSQLLIYFYFSIHCFKQNTINETPTRYNGSPHSQINSLHMVPISSDLAGTGSAPFLHKYNDFLKAETPKRPL